MISGINSSSVLASGNLSVLKKAMDTEENLMNSLLSGMQGASASMQTQATPAPQAPQVSAPTSQLDIMA
ncbi:MULTISPECIES: hypothetical protein [Helicobacter]|uniref:Motility protein n=1 Tax=Helicobacter ibis TaxID=2962633 RepID=A0ABT4VFX9_9HELI|nr:MULTISPECIES: hypothetical protein [Helicobacter]MDA3967964.1 hypothetical protein [Helicobacter sp. WB40]MDA3969632.1 hypothetical protein [Helicobacter ibis]